METRIFLFGEIGFDVQEADVLKQISEAKKNKSEQIVVEISSFGGFVYAGRAIYNALKLSGIPVRVEIIGQAFSIASYIAMAGDEILIAEKAEMMIHPAWSFGEGNADQLREMANELEKMSEEIFGTYVSRGADEAKIREYFENERILTASEAIDAGLATGLLQPVKAVAKLRVADFKSEKKINKNNKMENVLNTIVDKLDKLFARFEPKNGMIESEQGVLYFEGDVIEVGTAVYSDEALEVAAENGEYVEGNTTYVVVDGLVSEVLVDEPEEGDPSEEMAALREELDAAIAENGELKEANEALTTKLNEVKAEVQEIRDALKTNPVNTKNRRSEGEATIKTVAQIMKEKEEKNRSRYTI